MHSYFTARYKDDLQNFVIGYNSSYHRTIKMSPNKVTKEKETDLRTQFNQKILSMISLKIGNDYNRGRTSNRSVY
jgi:hypothetical protein